MFLHVLCYRALTKSQWKGIGEEMRAIKGGNGRKGENKENQIEKETSSRHRI